MSPQNEHELANTRTKLRILEESYDAARQDSSGGRHAQDLELRSLKQLINQLNEEIVRYECRRAVPAG